MMIELRNIHYSARFSQETALFDAAVFVDGKRVGMVSNEGHGGSNDYDFDTRPLEAYCKGLGAVETPWGVMAMDLELFLGDLLDKWVRDKEFSRLTKNRTVFKLKGDREGEYRTVKVPFGPEVKDRMVGKYGDRIEYFLNEKGSL